MSDAVDGMKTKRCFLEPPVNDWPSYKLAKLPLYDPCRAYFDAATALSKETIRHSTQLKQADGQEIHNVLEKFAESSLNLEDRVFVYLVFVLFLRQVHFCYCYRGYVSDCYSYH